MDTINDVLMIDKWTFMQINSISFYLKSEKRPLQKMAVRQKWPFIPYKVNRGKPAHIFSLDTLPDDVQESWAVWDEGKYEEAIRTEELKQNGRPDYVPTPTSIEQAKEALIWPDRTTFYMDVKPERYVKGPKPKVYDGKSRGLCITAKNALLKRFPELSETKRIYEITRSESTDFMTKHGLFNPNQELIKDQLIEKLKSDIELYKLLVHEKDRGISLLERLVSRQEKEIIELVNDINSLKQDIKKKNSNHANAS